MFAYYYVSKTPEKNGFHEVHIKGCRLLPEMPERIFLGSFYTSHNALQVGKLYFPRAKKCAICLLHSP